MRFEHSRKTVFDEADEDPLDPRSSARGFRGSSKIAVKATEHISSRLARQPSRTDGGDAPHANRDLRWIANSRPDRAPRPRGARPYVKRLARGVRSPGVRASPARVRSHRSESPHDRASDPADANAAPALVPVLAPVTTRAVGAMQRTRIPRLAGGISSGPSDMPDFREKAFSRFEMSQE